MARLEDAAVSMTATVVGTPARLFRATALVCGLFLTGMAGYRVVEGAPWFDALYMTVITITTVGFGEAIPLSPAGRVLTMTGDATLEATLLSANVQHARGLVSCLNDDAHNVSTVLTAHTLNPNLIIVARATEEGAERRILQAGANRVVNPYHLGGARLAHLVVKPAIVNFFDASVDGSDLQLDQTSLGTGGAVAGRTLAEANIRHRWGLGVVAVQRDNEVVASPHDDFRLQGGDVLVVFGSRQQITAFDTDCV